MHESSDVHQSSPHGSAVAIVTQPTADKIGDTNNFEPPRLFIFPWTLPHPSVGHVGTFLTPERAGNILAIPGRLGGWVIGMLKIFARKISLMCAEHEDATSNIV
jgi:hypothetical protein